jgi:DNA-binding response OmpR family regulator
VSAERDLTILVLAEAGEVRELICRMLKAPGRQILGTANAAEAVFLATTVDLLVCDIVPGGLDAQTSVNRLRSVKPDLPVLYISGWYDHPEFPDLGGEQILGKPFSRDMLNEAVAAALDRRPGR